MNDFIKFILTLSYDKLKISLTQNNTHLIQLKLNEYYYSIEFLNNTYSNSIILCIKNNNIIKAYNLNHTEQLYKFFK